MSDQNQDQQDQQDQADQAAAPAGPAAGHVRVRIVLGYQLVDDAGEKTHRLAGAVTDVPEEEALIESQRNRVQLVDPTTPLAEPSYPTTNPPQVE